MTVTATTPATTSAAGWASLLVGATTAPAAMAAAALKESITLRICISGDVRPHGPWNSSSPHGRNRSYKQTSRLLRVAGRVAQAQQLASSAALWNLVLVLRAIYAKNPTADEVRAYLKKLGRPGSVTEMRSSRQVAVWATLQKYDYLP